MRMCSPHPEIPAVFQIHRSLTHESSTCRMCIVFGKCSATDRRKNTELGTHCDKRHPQRENIGHMVFLKSIPQLLGLFKSWFQMFRDISRCHGSMYIYFVEGGLDLSIQHSIEQACCGLFCVYAGDGGAWGKYLLIVFNTYINSLLPKALNTADATIYYHTPLHYPHSLLSQTAAPVRVPVAGIPAVSGGLL